VCTLTGHSYDVTLAAFSKDGKRVVSGSWDYLVKIWNSETGAEVCETGVCNRRCDEFQAVWICLHWCFGVHVV